MLFALIGLAVSEGTGIFALAVTVAGVLALAWAISRTQALSAWRSAAEGYKEQVNELTMRLGHAEDEAKTLHGTISELERTLLDRPDLAGVIESVEATSSETAAAVVKAVRDLIEPVSLSLSELRATLSRPTAGRKTRQ